MHDPTTRIPAELALRIRLVILDVDGVLTDNGVYLGATRDGTPVELKRFDIVDGLGIRMLERAGIPVVLISGRESAATRIRADELDIESHQDPTGYKLAAAREVLEREGIGWEDTAAVCDDLADLPVMGRAGLPVAVANAVAEVKALARWRTRREGGNGAVREFAEALLEARGEWAGLVESYREEREYVEEAE